MGFAGITCVVMAFVALKDEFLSAEFKLQAVSSLG
jgi:hypothetical protein